MDVSFVAAQILGLLSLVTEIVSVQWRKRKNIVYFICLTNLICVVQFLLLQAYCGAILCAFGIVQVLINQYWIKKDKPVPKLLLFLYTMISVVLLFLTFQRVTDLFLLVSCCLFPWKVGFKNEQAIRVVSLLNSLAFLCFDFFVGAYVNLISGCLAVASTVVALVRYHKKNKN